MSGVRPESTTLPDPVDVSSADPLLDAARPVLDEAAVRIADTDMSLLLVDHECRMVSRVTAGATIERILDDAGASSGVAFTESAVGTTALGTPAEIRRGVLVNGSEHYLDRFKQLSCFGQPIIHPATRRLAGSLCMTEVGDRANPLSIPFVTAIVNDIADRLLDRSRAHQRRVLDAFQRAAPRRDVAVAALGDDLQLTNALAADLLSPTDIGALRMVVADPSLHATSMRTTLTSGTAVEVLVEPVGGTRGAAVFHLRPAPATPTRSPAPVSAPGASVPPVRSTAITGEPGTGRSTEAHRVATDLADVAPVVVDVAETLLEGTPPDVPALLTQARARGAALIVDGADLLDDRSLTLLRHVAARTSPTPLIVVTGPATQIGSGAAALLGQCGRRIELPPLRHRTAELAVIATSVITELAPGTELSSGAADALLSQEWPGNLTELVTALGDAVAASTTRGSRTVDLADLPERYRTTSRASRLAGREQAERQAIIDALDRNGHNKVHAARELGISRTTLYARIRALGI
ncbi:Fis family transcriptional regulator [Gordonia desulfuricans]|uniref:Fis family transcriptional regulator n=1 Tax=Gordonia desulfuricans TaxID=89051 RepID=A0A7K3LUW2_9ACTN|nr:helix-turn-helix domain-containing protein [Gordonia desulfuricans]NDK91367.1 Fis family transcriptional regulator [Gordonia desulfuricans]